MSSSELVRRRPEEGRTEEPQPERRAPQHALLALQRSAGNQAVARLVTASAPARGRVLARFKKGDFADLALFGLDVPSWTAFADVVWSMSHSSLTLALRFLDMRKVQDEDYFHARLIVEKRRAQLRTPPRSRILEAAFGTPSKEDIEPKGKEVEPKEKEVEPTVSTSEPKIQAPTKAASDKPFILIGDGLSVRTDRIESASDLLIWLVSHPTTSARTPGNWASSKVMLMLLNRLAQQRRMVDPGEVWNLLREVLKNGGDAGGSWPLGTWSTVSGTQFGTEKGDIGKREQPAQFERKLSWEERKQKMQELKQRLSRHKLVGTHATQMENIGPMILEGPSAARYGTGEGTGKGPGFYIIPADKNTASKSAERAQTWTPFVVAVYLPADCELIDAPEGKGVNEMEALYGGKRKYYGFAKQEAVIPFSLYSELIVLRDPGDISMADPTLPVEQTDDKEDQVEFTQDFKR